MKDFNPNTEALLDRYLSYLGPNSAFDLLEIEYSTSMKSNIRTFEKKRNTGLQEKRAVWLSSFFMLFIISIFCAGYTIID